jgi:hypothetical protein
MTVAASSVQKAMRWVSAPAAQALSTMASLETKPAKP